MAHRKRVRAGRLEVEALEGRMLLAGNVTATPAGDTTRAGCTTPACERPAPSVAPTNGSQARDAGSLEAAPEGEVALQPFRATIQASEVFSPTGQTGVFEVVIAGTGKGNLFGNLTFSATETIDFVSRPGIDTASDGAFVITASDGARLFATYTGTGVPDPDNPGVFLGESTATITGGTGRFAGASGTVPFSLSIDSATLTQTITFDSYAALIGAGDEAVGPDSTTRAGCATPSCQTP